MMAAPGSIATALALVLAMGITLGAAVRAGAGVTHAAPTGGTGVVWSSERQTTRIVLANGLTVLLVPDHKAPLVAMQLRYRVGAGDDPTARPGITALVQRLMMRATTHLREGDYDRYLDAAGAFDSNWSLTQDRTVFQVTVPADRLALPLWLWSDQMGFLADRLDERLIASELTMLRNERVEKRDNLPGGHVPDFAVTELYPAGHPYHAGNFRDATPLRGMTVRELRDFLESHYTPDRAILTLTGDFDARRAQALLERYFGSLPARAARPGQKPAATVTPTNPALALTAIAPSLIGEVRLKVAARVELPSVALYWPTVPFYEPGDAELDLVAELLVGRRAGWLRWKLIDELKIATGVWAHQASHALGSEFQIYATATPGHTPTELANAIDSVLRTLQSDPPNDHSFSGTLAGFLFDRALATEQNSVAANMYADCEDQGVRSGCVRFLFSRYTAVDAQRLSAVAAQALPLGRRVVVEVTPASDAPIAGELRSRSVVPE